MLVPPKKSNRTSDPLEGLTGKSNKKAGYDDDDFRAVASSVRTLYRLNGKIPTLEEIDAVCDRTRGKIAKVIASDTFLHAMDITGVPMRKTKGLSAKQHYLLMILTEPSDKRSLQQRLRDAHVTTAEYRAWLRNPIFASFLETFAEKALGEHLHVAHNSLLNQVEKGNVRALEFYYQITGRYDPRSTQERDITAIIAQILEIIQRNVKDTEALANIAEEFRGLMGGETKKALPTYRSEQVEDVIVVDEELLEDNERVEKMVKQGTKRQFVAIDEATTWNSEDRLTKEHLTSLEEKLAQGGAAANMEDVPSFMLIDKPFSSAPNKHQL